MAVAGGRLATAVAVARGERGGERPGGERRDQHAEPGDAGHRGAARTGRSRKRGRSSASEPNTMATSRQVERMSANAAGSDSPELGPIGMPIVRDTSHTSAIDEVADDARQQHPAGRLDDDGDGPRDLQPGHGREEAEPWYQVSLKWSAHHREVDARRGQREHRQAPAHVLPQPGLGLAGRLRRCRGSAAGSSWVRSSRVINMTSADRVSGWTGSYRRARRKPVSVVTSSHGGLYGR